MRIVNINNINNINLTRRQKLITFFESFINILIIIPILCFYLYLKRKSSKLNITNKNYKLDLSSINETNNNYNLSFRNLNSKQIINHIKYKHLIDTLTSKIYYGKWFTKSTENRTLVIGESISGLSEARLERVININTKEDSLAFIVSNYENDYINHWLRHSSFIINKNLRIFDDFINNKFIMKGLWETQLKYGELLDPKIIRYPCYTNFTFSFPKKNVTYLVKTNEEIFNFSFSSIDNSFFEVELNSLCGFNMSMEFSPLDNNNKYFNINKEKKQVFIYFILIGIVCVLNILNNITLIKDLSDNNEFVKCIPVFSLGYNINWHIYCCITNISFSFDYQEYYFQFSTLGLAYLINILFYDIRLSCVLWNIIKSRTSNRTYIQKRMIYFSSFYIFIIFSFFTISDLMIYIEGIFVIGILAWTPQIIHNFIYYNKYIYSILYIISFTLDKIIFGIYFRANDNNFLRIKGDKKIIMKLNLYILSNLFIFFLQYKFGPRFCLGKICQKQESKLYKTKKELIDEIKDVNTMECVICLMPILDQEKNVTPNLNIVTPNLNINANGNKNNNKDIINQSMNSTNEIKINNELPLAIENNNKINIDKKLKINNNKKEKIKINKIKFKDIIKCLAPFYKFSKKIDYGNKPYMKTPCNHIFHKECLERWLLLKKECPNCRTDLSDNI